MIRRLESFARLIVPKRFWPVVRSFCKKIYITCKKTYYSGSRYSCPFCICQVRTFLPLGFYVPVLIEKKVVGGGYRAKNLCPVCHSFDRERLLYLYLLHKTDIFKKQNRVLHIAAEAKIKEVLSGKENLDYITADLYEENVMVTMDATNIPFPDNGFDVIICNHVLEHIIDDRKAMAELFRVLKPGGWAILQVPMSLSLDKTYEDFSITNPKNREKCFGQYDHVRIYAKDYAERLVQAGFEVNVFSWAAELETFGGITNKFSLNEGEDVYLTRKLHISA
jgi:predicted SAM-dependent methyltransferase